MDDLSVKVGIVTYHTANNYGAALQTYAMQTILRKIGAEPTIIDYKRNRSDTSVFQPWTHWKKWLINCFTMLRYRQAKHYLHGFRAFRDKHYKLSSKCFYSSDDLSEIAGDFDAIICGSDQIWRPSNNQDQMNAYTLSFVQGDRVKKIAYAPSFGVSSLPGGFKENITPQIKRMNCLSVREETGKQIIHHMAGCDCKVVLDPTLLLDSKEWSHLEEKSCVQAPYILVYSLSQKKNFCALVKHVKSKTKLPVVVISYNALNLIPAADQVIYDAAPGQFLGLFANASCVCTNTFHGTAFSIIYKRPFWTTPHGITNSRLVDLLQKVDLAERQVSDIRALPEHLLEIDYTHPTILWEKERKSSIQFLKESLSLE